MATDVRLLPQGTVIFEDISIEQFEGTVAKVIPKVPTKNQASQIPTESQRAVWNVLGLTSEVLGAAERPSARPDQRPHRLRRQGASVWGEGHQVQGDPAGGGSHPVQHLHRPQGQAGEGHQHRHPARHLRLHQGDPGNGEDQNSKLGF